MPEPSRLGSCPLCTDALNAVEARTQLCDCGYQVCAFCYNQLQEAAAAAGLPPRCPACRRAAAPPQPRPPPLPPLPAAEEDLLADDGGTARRRRETRPARGAGRDESGGGDSSAGLPERRRLAHVRVIQRNLVYVVGLTMAVCREEARARLATPPRCAGSAVDEGCAFWLSLAAKALEQRADATLSRRSC